MLSLFLLALVDANAALQAYLVIIITEEKYLQALFDIEPPNSVKD